MDYLLKQILLDPVSAKGSGRDELVMIGNSVGSPLITSEHERVVIGEDLHAALAGL